MENGKFFVDPKKLNYDLGLGLRRGSVGCCGHFST